MHASEKRLFTPLETRWIIRLQRGRETILSLLSERREDVIGHVEDLCRKRKNTEQVK